MTIVGGDHMRRGPPRGGRGAHRDHGGRRARYVSDPGATEPRHAVALVSLGDRLPLKTALHVRARTRRLFAQCRGDIDAADGGGHIPRPQAPTPGARDASML